LLKDLRKDRCLKCHAFTLKDSVSHSIFHRVTAGHQCGTGGCTGRTNHKTSEPRARVVKFIEIRCPDPRMPMPANWPVTLIIGDNENDVWLFCLCFI